MREQSNIKTWPERIYLQHGDSPEVPAFHDVYPGNGYSDSVTWCQDRIEAADVEYVRADVAASVATATGDKQPLSIDEEAASIDKPVAQLAVPEAPAYAELLRKIDEFPELNMNNYTEDQVRELNYWGVRIALAAQEITAPVAPVQPAALASSIAELDQLANSDEGELAPSQAESVLLVLHELKRLQAQPETWKVLPSPAADEWISIEERLPEPKTIVLLTVHYENQGEDDDGNWHATSGAVIDFGQYVGPEHGGYIEAFASPHGQHEYISHWKPLPAPAPMPAAPTGELKQAAVSPNTNHNEGTAS